MVCRFLRVLSRSCEALTGGSAAPLFSSPFIALSIASTLASESLEDNLPEIELSICGLVVSSIVIQTCCCTHRSHTCSIDRARQIGTGRVLTIWYGVDNFGHVIGGV